MRATRVCRAFLIAKGLASAEDETVGTKTRRTEHCATDQAVDVFAHSFCASHPTQNVDYSWCRSSLTRTSACAGEAATATSTL